MWVYDPDHAAKEAQSRRDAVRQRAQDKHGGPTTAWAVAQRVKKVAQKYDIGDLLRIEGAKPGSKTFTIKIVGNITSRFAANNARDGVDNTYFRFFTETVKEVEDCGYRVAVGDDYWEVSVA